MGGDKVDVDAITSLELVSAATVDLSAKTTMVIDAAALTLSGTTIKVKDKANSKEYDLIKAVSGSRRRLEAIEAKQKEDADSPTTEELSAQIQELWEILQMMQKHYVQLMEDSKTAGGKSSDS